MDATTRLVCNISETVLLVTHADVASLWSATRIQQYLGETGGRERVRLVLNRFRKIAGFSEAQRPPQIASSTRMKPKTETSKTLPGRRRRR